MQNFILKAIKIACLTYTPSKILFDNNMFDRNDLVQAQGYLLCLALE